jgi:hypothetical protein
MHPSRCGSHVHESSLMSMLTGTKLLPAPRFGVTRNELEQELQGLQKQQQQQQQPIHQGHPTHRTQEDEDSNKRRRSNQFLLLVLDEAIALGSSK